MGRSHLGFPPAPSLGQQGQGGQAVSAPPTPHQQAPRPRPSPPRSRTAMQSHSASRWAMVSRLEVKGSGPPPKPPRLLGKGGCPGSPHLCPPECPVLQGGLGLCFLLRVLLGPWAGYSLGPQRPQRRLWGRCLPPAQPKAAAQGSRSFLPAVSSQLTRFLAHCIRVHTHTHTHARSRAHQGCRCAYTWAVRPSVWSAPEERRKDSDSPLAVLRAVSQWLSPSCVPSPRNPDHVHFGPESRGRVVRGRPRGPRGPGGNPYPAGVRLR